MSRVNLNLTPITDENTRTALRNIQEALNASNLRDFKLLEISLAAGLTDLKVAHGLGYIPTDIFTSKSTGTYVWNYDKFTRDYLSITTTSTVTIRCLVGRID